MNRLEMRFAAARHNPRLAAGIRKRGSFRGPSAPAVQRGHRVMIRWLVPFLISLFALPTFAADSIKLAITGPFTGGSAPMGASMRDGAKLAISEINDAGGVEVGGKKLKIETIERDDEAKNE